MYAYWAVGKVKPNQDKIAIQNLRNQGFENYYPRTLELKRTRQGMQRCPVPLFPSYIFIRVINKWACLNSTHGLAGVLMSSGYPAVVNDKTIEQLRQREIGGIIRLPKERRFAEGDTVTINAGPFAGQQGLVERMSSRERQNVLLALLSGSAKVLIDEENLEAA